MGQYLNYRNGVVKRQNREWEDAWLRTREIVYQLYNGRVTKRADLRSHNQLIPLPSDRPDVRPTRNAAAEAKAFFAALDAHLAQLPSQQ